ncbi:hypothetical protein EV121DRAFT_295961 [Schizophyllum commune]
MSLISPLPGAYAVVTLDPVESLKVIGVDDPLAEEECRKMVCGRYIACITKPTNEFDMMLPQCTFNFDFVVQGLPPDDPSTFYHHSMSVPIFPNLNHPYGRRSLRACPPLPWDDCYHALPFHVKGRCPVRISTEWPDSCLDIDEAEVLGGFMRNDDDHVYLQEEARDAGRPLSISPIPDINPDLQMTIKFADEQPLTFRPWWRDIIDRQLSSTDSPRVASQSLLADAEADTYMVNSDLAELIQMQFSIPSDELYPFVRFTYDLSSFASPPHPSGFLREVEGLKKIYQGYLDRRRDERATHVDEVLANDVAPVDEASTNDDAHVAEPEATDDALSAESQAHGRRVEMQPRTKLRTFRRFTRRYFDLALDQTRSLGPARLRQKALRFHSPASFQALIRFLATVPRRFRQSAD